MGAENLPSNVISFSLSLSVFLRVLKAERDRENEADSFRESERTAEERGDPKELLRRKDDREEKEEEALFDFYSFF